MCSLKATSLCRVPEEGVLKYPLCTSPLVMAVFDEFTIFQSGNTDPEMQRRCISEEGKDHKEISSWCQWSWKLPSPWKRGQLSALYMERINNRDLLCSTRISQDKPSWKRIWKIVYVYMYNWITLLCSRNEHNIVNQFYFHNKGEGDCTGLEGQGYPLSGCLYK